MDKFKEGSDNVRDQIENAGEQIDRFCLKVGQAMMKEDIRLLPRMKMADPTLHPKNYGLTKFY